MTNRDPVSAIQNIWFDSEQVDNDDLTTEQNYNNSIQTGLINNHIGSGVLPEVLEQNVLFDSLLVNGLLDGTNIQAQNQPSDKNNGNQLEIELTNSNVAGKKSIKVAIIGLDFQGNLQYDTFTFKVNERQFTKKHYTNILTILFNDFIGPVVQSFNLGGRITIKEARPFSLSRDPIMVAQDIEPNLVFRDFFVTNTLSLMVLLQNSLPLFNIDSLNINLGFKTNNVLASGDVSTQIGEKFLATTNNIQKVTLLLSVQNTSPGQATVLNWQGDLIISIYPLQTVVECPTDISPNLAIEFSPSNIPLAQISVNFTTLQQAGVQLDGTPQPVDFVFSNTLVASGNSIIPGNYYAVTVKRSGSANQCDILIATGSNHVENSRVTIFSPTSNSWVDIPEDNLWFKIWNDAAKVSDGQAYETGHGIIIPKTIQDPITNAQEDYALTGIQFTGNDVFSAVVSATVEQSGELQDQRTGDPVKSRQQFVPSIRLLNPIDITNLEKASEPFIIGVISDKNQKSFDASSSTLSAAIHAWSFVNNKLVLKIIDDMTDGYRFDPNVNALVSNLLNGDLINAKLVPDASNQNVYYRISKAELCSMIYGDIDGNGIVDNNDLALLNTLIGINLNSSPPPLSQITTNGSQTTVTNGYVVYAKPFVDDFGITFQVVDPNTTNVIAAGTDGILIVNPNNGSLASFESTSINFSTISNLNNLNLVISGSANTQDNGAFTIIGVDVAGSNIIDIRKILLTGDVIEQILRADIDGNMKIDGNDGYLLESYIQKSSPFPPQTLPSSKIGTQFSAIMITVDPFLFDDTSMTTTDRTDDFPFDILNRATVLHPTQDIYNNDGYLQNHDFLHSPVTFNIVKQLTWESNLISENGDARFVPCVFTSLTGFTKNNCSLAGITCETYPIPPEFDPGRDDVFVPNNLIMGNGGEIVREDGYIYKIDFEVGTIVLDIPPGLLGNESVINIFDNFVSDFTGTGVTRLGYPAMKFADCSTVSPTALINNQVLFSVALQSFSPNINGIDPDGYTGPIVDGKMGVFIDYATGTLRLNFTNLYQDPTLQTLVTKVQINVYLKKAGFNNIPLVVDSATVANIFTLIT